MIVQPASHTGKFNLMIDQRAITDMGGTMRLGLYPCDLMEGSKAREAYGTERVDERHRHRFEFNNAYREEFEQGGMARFFDLKRLISNLKNRDNCLLPFVSQSL